MHHFPTVIISLIMDYFEIKENNLLSSILGVPVRSKKKFIHEMALCLVEDPDRAETLIRQTPGPFWSHCLCSAGDELSQMPISEEHENACCKLPFHQILPALESLQKIALKFLPHGECYAERTKNGILTEWASLVPLLSKENKFLSSVEFSYFDLILLLQFDHEMELLQIFSSFQKRGTEIILSLKVFLVEALVKKRKLELLKLFLDCYLSPFRKQKPRAITKPIRLRECLRNLIRIRDVEAFTVLFSFVKTLERMKAFVLSSSLCHIAIESNSPDIYLILRKGGVPEGRSKQLIFTNRRLQGLRWLFFLIPRLE